MTTVRDLLKDRDHILVGFEGVLCNVAHDDKAIADRLKILVGYGMPEQVKASGDPFEVLRYAATCGAATASAVERQLRRLELPTVTHRPPIPGAGKAMTRLAAAGNTLTAVSGLAADVVRSFFSLHDIGESVSRVAARVSADTPLPPDPHLVHQAMRSRGASPDQCVMIAGTMADIEAALAAEIPVIAFGLQAERAALVVHDMVDIASAGAADFTWRRH
jgi:phosphoglycolate phosphatase-like HAD superfamily hydrolase